MGCGYVSWGGVRWDAMGRDVMEWDVALVGPENELELLSAPTRSRGQHDASACARGID